MTSDEMAFCYPSQHRLITRTWWAVELHGKPIAMYRTREAAEQHRFNLGRDFLEIVAREISYHADA